MLRFACHKACDQIGLHWSEAGKQGFYQQQSCTKGHLLLPLWCALHRTDTWCTCRQADPASPSASVEYLHAGAEALPMQDSSLDLFAASYLLHELPASATHDVLAEAQRVLRPGGVIALIDGDPW